MALVCAQKQAIIKFKYDSWLPENNQRHVPPNVAKRMLLVKKSIIFTASEHKTSPLFCEAYAQIVVFMGDIFKRSWLGNLYCKF